MGAKRFIGATALSAAALASLGAGTANADEVCSQCELRFPQPGLNNAFYKLELASFPGNTENAFHKVGAQYAFWKLGNLEFPGNTGNVFEKQ